MTTVLRLGRIIGWLALAAAMAGCSAVKLGYNNLGDVAYWWLDSYIDFSDEQAGRVREELSRLHLWHRTQELPRLAEMLHRMEELAPGDISPTQACQFVEQARERASATAEQGEMAVVTVAAGLTPDQFAHLERKYARNNAEFRRKWIGPSASELADKRLQQFVSRSEAIYGSLDEAQRLALRRELEPSVFNGSRLLAERVRRQQDALQVLRKLAGESVPLDEARGLLRGYLARTREPPDPEQRRLQHALIDEGCRAISVMHNATSADQRQSAVRRLRAYQRDLRELAAQK
jgi:hypothetical protein